MIDLIMSQQVAFTDSQIVLDAIRRETVSGRTRRFILQISLLQGLQKHGLVFFEKISSKKTLADLMTKPFDETRHNNLIQWINHPELRGLSG